MFSAEVRKMLVQVITSWQVIVVTVVLVIYIFLVKYVARTHQGRSWQPSTLKGKKSKASDASIPAAAPAARSGSDELDLEEEETEK